MIGRMLSDRVEDLLLIKRNIKKLGRASKANIVAEYFQNYPNSWVKLWTGICEHASWHLQCKDYITIERATEKVCVFNMDIVI